MATYYLVGQTLTLSDHDCVIIYKMRQQCEDVDLHTGDPVQW